MDFAAEVNCPIVTIWPGQDGYDYLFQADYIQERRWFTEGIKSACAHRTDIDLTLEYKIKEPRTHSYVSSAATTLLMIADCGSPNLGVVLDYGHAALGYETPAESVALLSMYGDKLRHVHINDNFGIWDDDMIVGTVHTMHYLEFFYWLERTGYHGYITIDQFPYREDGRAAVEESALWIDTLQSMIEGADQAAIATALAGKDAIAASRVMRSIIAPKTVPRNDR
jgi:xylose isomerase